MADEKVKNLEAWLDEKSITDIEVIDISDIAVDMDCFVIGTAPNERVAKTAADHIEEKCDEFDYPIKGREGKELGKWILIDLTDVVVHIFQKEERKLYSLEKLWADGKFIKKA
jgi:ribosome-associated protein